MVTLNRRALAAKLANAAGAGHRPSAGRLVLRVVVVIRRHFSFPAFAPTTFSLERMLAYLFFYVKRILSAILKTATDAGLGSSGAQQAPAVH